MPHLCTYGNVAEPPAAVLGSVETEYQMPSDGLGRGNAVEGEHNGRCWVPAVRPPSTGNGITSNGSGAARGDGGQEGGSSALHSSHVGHGPLPSPQVEQPAQVCAPQLTCTSVQVEGRQSDKMYRDIR